jgi:hypothetical protein
MVYFYVIQHIQNRIPHVTNIKLISMLIFMLSSKYGMYFTLTDLLLIVV